MFDRPISITLIAAGENRRIDGYAIYKVESKPDEHRVAFEANRVSAVRNGLTIRSQRRIIQQLADLGIKPIRLEVITGRGVVSYDTTDVVTQ